MLKVEFKRLFSYDVSHLISTRQSFLANILNILNLIDMMASLWLTKDCYFGWFFLSINRVIKQLSQCFLTKEGILIHCLSISWVNDSLRVSIMLLVNLYTFSWYHQLFFWLFKFFFSCDFLSHTWNLLFEQQNTPDDERIQC